MQYLKTFTVTGSLCPSSRYFGERAAVEVARLAGHYDRVIVAGIGSGVVASRILRHCPDAVFVEIEPRFAAPFSKRHPEAIVIVDRLESLYEHRPELRDSRLLLASFIPTAGSFYNEDLVRMFVQVCRGGGSVIQMRYLPHRMSARFFEVMQQRGIASERLFTVARNFPPVSMFELRARLGSVTVPAVALPTAKIRPAHLIARGTHAASRSSASARARGLRALR